MDLCNSVVKNITRTPRFCREGRKPNPEMFVVGGVHAETWQRHTFVALTVCPCKPEDGVPAPGELENFGRRGGALRGPASNVTKLMVSRVSVLKTATAMYGNIQMACLRLAKKL